MKRHILFLNLLCFALLFGLPLTSRAQYSEGRIVDPLTFSGTVGTQITSSWNNSDLHYSAPFSTTAYANMTFNLYGISIPMSVNLVNTSADQFSFSNPVFTINFRPIWKKFTFHFGTSSMNFSNYTYNGISFSGVGVEYKGDKFRFGGFYGNFNRATVFRTELDDRDAIQYLSDSLLGLNNVAYTTMPQYKRKAYAAHIAVGTRQHYLDLSLLHAADDINSLPSEWYMYNVLSADVVDTVLVVRDSTVKGKENLAMGLKAHFDFGEHVTFEGNLAASFITPDVTRDELTLSGNGGLATLANDVMGGLRKIGLFNTRYGSEVHLAGDVLLGMNFKPVSLTLTYRAVQPNYTSLGANGFNQNSRVFGGHFSTSLFHRMAFLQLHGYLQRDNLDKKQLYTNQVGSYTASWSNFFGENVALSILYNAVTQNQYDGVLEVPEETRINHFTQSLDVSPKYTLSLENDHTFSLNFNLLQNKNLNKQMEGMSFDVSTKSFGLGYDVYFSKPRISLETSYDFSLSRSPGNDYNSHCFSLGTTYDFVKKEDLKLSGSAKLVMAYNVEKSGGEDLSNAERQVLDYLARRIGSRSTGEITNDLSVASRLSASLNYRDQHRATVYFSVSNYSDNIIIGQHVAVDTDLRFMVEYSYSFASRLIKSKKRK